MSQASEPRLPSVVVMTLGGTIAAVAEVGEAADVRLSGTDLLAAVPEVGALARVEVRSFRQVPSGDLTLDEVIALATEIRRSLEAGAEGIVVTQGTDTLEETSYALDLLLDGEAPVVLTGAMRSASLPGADGPANLLAAVRVAASGLACGLGVLVVLNDEIHAARFVRKRHTTSTASFGSPLAGPLGHVTEGRVRILLRPPGRLHIPLSSALPRDPGVRVALMPVWLDDDGAALASAVELGYAGLVLGAFGGGHVPRRLVPIIETVNRAIPVVLASRTVAGEMLRSSYAYPGSETDLLSRGVISAGALDAVHARILLQLLLMAGCGRKVIASCFEEAMTVRGVAIASTDGLVT